MSEYGHLNSEGRDRIAELKASALGVNIGTVICISWRVLLLSDRVAQPRRVEDSGVDVATGDRVTDAV